MDPDQELPRMQNVLETVVFTAMAEMRQNIEDDTEWDNDTRTNAAEILQILDDALAATVQQVFPGGVPPNKYKRGRHWNSKNRELANLIPARRHDGEDRNNTR